MTPAREVTHRRKRLMGLTLHIDIADVSTAFPASKRTSPELAACHIASGVPPASHKELQVIYWKDLNKSSSFLRWEQIVLSQFLPHEIGSFSLNPTKRREAGILVQYLDRTKPHLPKQIDLISN